MNIIDAAHKTVHAYPGGSESLGPRIGMSAAVLRNKVNPNNATHHLTLAEAAEIMSVTGDTLILQQLAAAHGFGLVALQPAPEGTGLMFTLLAADTCKGEFSEELQAALVDGRITENEMRALSNAGNSVQTAMVVLLSVLRREAERGRA